MEASSCSALLLPYLTRFIRLTHRYHVSRDTANRVPRYGLPSALGATAGKRACSLPALAVLQRSFIHRYRLRRPEAASGRTDRACQNFSHIHNGFDDALSSPNAQPPNHTHQLSQPRFPSGLSITEKATKKSRKPQKKPVRRPPPTHPSSPNCRFSPTVPSSTPPSARAEEKQRIRLFDEYLPSSPVLPRTFALFATLRSSR